MKFKKQEQQINQDWDNCLKFYDLQFVFFQSLNPKFTGFRGLKIDNFDLTKFNEKRLYFINSNFYLAQAIEMINKNYKGNNEKLEKLKKLKSSALDEVNKALEFENSKTKTKEKEERKDEEKSKLDKELERLKEFENSLKVNEVKYAELAEFDESRYILKDYIPFSRQCLSLISGSGGIGKSTLLLQLALIFSESLNVKCYLTEDDSSSLKNRINAIKDNIFNDKKFIENYKQITPNFDNIVFETAEKTNCFSFLDVSKKFVEDFKHLEYDKRYYDALKNSFKRFDVVIIDPLISFYQEDENSNQKARLFCDVINKIAQENNQAIILIHHNNKDNSAMRGASAFRDACRTAYSLSLIDETFENLYVNNNFYTHTIELEKDNLGIRQFFSKYGARKKIKVDCFENDFSEQNLKEYLNGLKDFRERNLEVGTLNLNVQSGEFWRFIYVNSLNFWEYADIKLCVENCRLDYLYTVHRIFIVNRDCSLIDDYENVKYKPVIKKIKNDHLDKINKGGSSAVKKATTTSWHDVEKEDNL